ncbi:MAG TPA: efflux RND transporter periplasmic adaptor subunit [Bryobacteraceae bacterium]|nr:efflux RND transporter periplasmic adaptor subunit [Bryobacteraceae bacterium]
MKRKWKILLFVVLILLVGGGVFASIKFNERGIVGVQTGKVVKQDLTSTVTASGEIKPRNYINLGANTFGPAPITDILVKEGDHVRKGQVVAKLESVQANADVVAQKAAIDTALADSAASEANVRSMADAIRTAQATVERSKTEVQRTKLNIDRATELYNSKLIAKQDYDQKKAEFDSANSALGEAQARYEQAKSQEGQARQQLDSAQKRIAQLRASLMRYSDVLEKYFVTSPIDGIVTNLPVRKGETVVPGVQNSAASTIMTVADMSLITAEVKVDETDIVNVKIDQVADITIDAMPNKTFKGHVTEIGNTAILRSTGLAASQSAVSSQEAKDFKVVIALDNPPDDIRPGLSCTGKIVTATRQHVLTVPIQALTVRQRGELEPPNKNKSVQAAAKSDPAAEKAKKEELTGVFVVKNGKAEFLQVTTGITGSTDIEVLTGLNDGDQIVTGSYKTIRTLRNFAKVKVDNKVLTVKSES